MENKHYNLGLAIKKVRHEKGVTAKFICSKLDIHASTLSKYESNQRKIKADTLNYLANALGVTVDYFFNQNVGDMPMKKESA